MSKKLTHEFIATRVKNDRIENIKSINFWGNDIEEVSILRQMQSLEVISLSVNKIKSLRDFGALKNLRELYLRKNQISDINEVKFLATCPNLKVLWINENPIAEIKNYRNIVISFLPNLSKLDDNFVSPEERSQALNAQNDEENLSGAEGELSQDNYLNHEEDGAFEVNDFEVNSNANNLKVSQAQNPIPQSERNLNKKIEKENDSEIPYQKNRASANVIPNVNVNVNSSVDIRNKNNNNEENDIVVNKNNKGNFGKFREKEKFKEKENDHDDYRNNEKERYYERERERDRDYDRDNDSQRNYSPKFKNQNYPNANNKPPYQKQQSKINNNIPNKNMNDYDDNINNNYPKYDYNRGNKYNDEDDENYVNQKMDNISINDKRNDNNNSALLKRLSSKKPSEMDVVDSNQKYGNNNNDYNDYENQRRGKYRENPTPQNQRERDEQYYQNQSVHRSNTYNVNSNYSYGGANRNKIYQSRNDNVVNSILLLLKEVNENDLNYIRDEIDKKLSYY